MEAIVSPEEDRSARPVSPLWILGTLTVLLMLAGGTMFLAKPRGAVLDPVETQEELFGSVSETVAYGLVPSEARRLPTGEVVLKYEASDGAGAGVGPESLTLIDFPVNRAESVLEEQFQKLRFDSAGGMGGGRGGGRGGGGRRSGGGPPGGAMGGMHGGAKKPKLQDAGFMDWQGFSANYARLRHTTSAGAPGAKPAFYDTLRVNLSTGGRCMIAYVRFPSGVEGTVAAAGELLGSFEPHVAASSAD